MFLSNQNTLSELTANLKPSAALVTQLFSSTEYAILFQCKRVKITLSRSDSRDQSLLELNFTLLRVNFVYDYSSLMNCHSHKSEELTAKRLANDRVSVSYHTS